MINIKNKIYLAQININIEIISKIYKEIAEEFSEFADSRKETQKDLISLALVEFVNKYRR
ncbi:hypothetical protein [Clostridium tagluense]|uniref:hypothetical protein n=1 Tax=Clostridium tagluense TaxID=360422 RepID=UPI001C0C61FB|nr:hypothetical protein [Clostridium tagluense]MBU3130572.1 hypothetical protein [Clostridium tagluense]